MNCFRIIYIKVNGNGGYFFLSYWSRYSQVEIHQWRRSCFWCQCWIWIWLVYWKYTLHIEYWGLVLGPNHPRHTRLANGNIRPIRIQRKYSSIPEVIKLWWRIQDSKGRSFYWACIIYNSIKYGHHKNSSEYPCRHVIGLNKANSLGQPLTKLWPYRTCPLPVVDYHST